MAESPSMLACEDSSAPGVWDVSLDYGGGKTGMQLWRISRDYCTLTIVSEPIDEYSPPSSHYGFVTEAGFRVSWINTVGACDYCVDMSATTAENSFTGPIDWRRRASGTGVCLPAEGRIVAAAVRR